MIIQNDNTCICIVSKINPMCSKSLLCASTGQNYINHHMLSYENELQAKKIYQGNFTLHVTLFVYFREYRFLCNK